MSTLLRHRAVPVLIRSKKGATRMSLTESEFTVLRQTIAARGTVRMVLLPATLFGWSAAAGTLLLVGDFPVAAVFPLAILAGGFEAIHALHVGVERIGRYLQVFYETRSDGPQWETTAMKVGPALPGGGIDPLFTVLFVCAALVNLIPAFLPGPTILELSVIGGLHAAFIVRVVRARGAAARQRAVELDNYRALRAPGEISHS
jgi:hypothetical protein